MADVAKPIDNYYIVPVWGNENVAYDDDTIQDAEYAYICDVQGPENEYVEINGEKKTDSGVGEQDKSRQYEALNIEPEAATRRKCPAWLKMASCIGIIVIIGFAILISVLVVLLKKGNMFFIILVYIFWCSYLIQTLVIPNY